jgi:hypothetical protein
MFGPPKVEAANAPLHNRCKFHIARMKPTIVRKYNPSSLSDNSEPNVVTLIRLEMISLMFNRQAQRLQSLWHGSANIPVKIQN